MRRTSNLVVFLILGCLFFNQRVFAFNETLKSMEVKKPQQSTASGRAVTTKQLREFVADIKSEIQKITWTSRDELIAYTKIVIGATFIFGMAIYFSDLIIQSVLNVLNFLLNFISG